jgi:TM2 domain-containing membrane protein YozV
MAAPGAKSKMAAGLLGIFLGCWGVHNFYLGYTGKAVGQLVLSIVGILTS